MKRYGFILILATLLVGCNNEVTKETPKAQNDRIDLVKREVNFENITITVEENTNVGYKDLRIIEDKRELKQIEVILDKLEWQKAKVKMSDPPHLRFISEEGFFAIWITPEKDRIEMIVEGESLYQKLPMEDSNLLFEKLTNKKLSDYDRWY